jgi:hypothetical protein
MPQILSRGYGCDAEIRGWTVSPPRNPQTALKFALIFTNFALDLTHRACSANRRRMIISARLETPWYWIAAQSLPLTAG